MIDSFIFKPEDYPAICGGGVGGVGGVGNEWKNFVISQFAQEYFHNISKKIQENYEAFEKEMDIYPPKPLIFRAFELTPFQNVKVVLLGQG